MSEYEIGRDIQELRGRLDRLEGDSRGGPCGPGRSNLGTGRHFSSGGISHHEPARWQLKAGERLPPILLSHLGLPFPPVQLNAPLDSTTWPCHPEPLVQTVFWSDSGRDEFYRFVNQTFSFMRWTNPNTGEVSASVTYSATKIASGKAQNYYTSFHNMAIAVRNSGGSPIFNFGDDIWVHCNDNTLFTISRPIDPGLYDLIGGATWEIHYSGILRC